MIAYKCRLKDGKQINIAETTHKNAAVNAIRKAWNVQGSIYLEECANPYEADIEVVGPRVAKYFKQKKTGVSKPAQSQRQKLHTSWKNEYMCSEDVFNTFGKPTAKGLTVNQLYGLLQLQIKYGNGDKHIVVSSDDECNSFHTLWEGVCSDPVEIKKWFAVSYDHDNHDPNEVVIIV